jgi:NhaP-type Na+/H+ or K+/H+ antiporter
LGQLATVTAGLYISWNGLRLISAATRLQGVFFWEFLVYLIEGMVFLITGLQARTLIAGIRGYSGFNLAISATVVSVVVIIARFAWMYPATYLPRWLIPAIRRKDPPPPWQWPTALAFTGVRGIVSLAAALGIPFTTDSSEMFQQREHRSGGDRGRRKLAELNDEIELQLIEAERQAINDRYRRGQLKDEARRSGRAGA